MEKFDLEGSRAIEEKLRKFEVVTLSRLRLSPADGTLVSGCPCGNAFGLTVRQHHCRSCGQIFCWACTEKRTNVPEALVEYQNKDGWWTPIASSRVCKTCYDRITKYEECKPLLDVFYSKPHLLERIFSLEGNGNELTKRAVRYYLSEMKRIPYLFPSESLTASQIDFLRANRVALGTNPEVWLMQILKIESVTSSKKLLVHNAIDMLLFSKIYRNSLEIALQVLSITPPEHLIPYLPVIAAIPDLRLYDILVEKSSACPQMAFAFYWALNVLVDSSKEELAVSHREHLLVSVGEIGSRLINFRRFIGTLDKGMSAMRSSVEIYKTPDPLSLGDTIISIDDMRVGDSHSNPIFVTYSSRAGEEEDLRRTRSIMLKHEDTRKDACIIKIIRMLAEGLGHIKDPFPLITYAVIPINSRRGIVEIVEKSETLFSIASSGSIHNYLQRHNAERTIGDVQDTYTLSLAFWTIITYIFGVGDRHFENIMLSSTGILFHIDYGFIFGIDPKPYSAKIRLNSYMLDGIGGEQRYPEFKEICYKIFTSIRKNIDKIYTYLLEMVVADPRIEGLNVTEPFIRDHLSKVFFIGEPEEEIRSRLEFIIDSAKNSIGAFIGEYLHSTAKSTSKFIGRWSGQSSSPV